MHFTGSCLCGEITFIIKRPMHTLGHCACALCCAPRAGGYKHWAMLGHNQFYWSGGQERLESVTDTHGKVILRCTSCKDVLVRQEDRVLAKVTVDAIASEKPSVEHVFVADRAVWHEIADRATAAVPA